MKTSHKIILLILLIVSAFCLSSLYLFMHSTPILDPKGVIAIKQRELISICSLLMCIVVIPVIVMTIFFTWKYREENKKAKYRPEWGHSYLAEGIWWSIPFVIVAVLAVITWFSTHELNPFKPLESEKKPITIQVVALEWKWLFLYPEEGIATVNYIQFPEKTPLNFEITADAPMNSFWIPALGGQIYAMPSMRTKLHLMANEVGQFQGSSSNLSGSGFSGMTFQAVSSTEKEFSSWVDLVKNSGERLTEEAYECLAAPSSYVKPEYFSSFGESLFEKVVKKYQPPCEVSK